jgi:hypothetical protein
LLNRANRNPRFLQNVAAVARFPPFCRNGDWLGGDAVATAIDAYLCSPRSESFWLSLASGDLQLLVVGHVHSLRGTLSCPHPKHQRQAEAGSAVPDREQARAVA